MAITVQCVCGKRTGVSDALAGKVIRCPACGDAVVVTGTPALAAAGAAPARGRAVATAPRGGVKTQQASPKIDISRGQVILFSVVGGLLLLGAIFYFGPVRVWQQWGALEPKASDDVRSLVVFSLKEHMKEDDLDPMSRRRQPSAESHDVSFFQPLLAFTMPEKVPFIGKSSQGTFSGHYYPQTGVVDATVSYGGISVGGMVDIGKPTGTLHLVGHMDGRKAVMEIDGKKIST